MDEPPRHGLADFLEEELPRLEEEWQQGSYRALLKAFGWCSLNGYKFPKWLRSAVLDDLLWAMENRPRGGTKQGNAAAQERARSIHRTRHTLVEQMLKFQESDRENGRRAVPASEAEAARQASTFLREHQHFARGSAAAILKSYKMLKSG
jgi:hypothetical protein